MKAPFRHICCVLALAVLALLVGCKPSVPGGVLSEGKMERVLYDYHLAQGAAELHPDDVTELRYQYVQAVFRKHGITEAEFDRSMAWYSAHSIKLKGIYDRLDARLESEAKGLGVGVSDTELYAGMSEIGDTANIWTGARMLFLQDDVLHSLTTLTMQADSNFLAGDTYRLGFDSHFIGDRRRDVFAFLVVCYTDGQTRSVMQRISSEYSNVLTLPYDSSRDNAMTERIIITFYVPVTHEARDTYYFFITNPSLLRIHKPKDEPSAKEKTDSAEVETPTDSLLPPVHLDTTTHVRLSPEEFRGSKDIKREINVVKERPVRRMNTNGRPTNGRTNTRTVGVRRTGPAKSGPARMEPAR